MYKYKNLLFEIVAKYNWLLHVKISNANIPIMVFLNPWKLQNPFQLFESTFFHINIFNSFSQSQGREIASLRTRNVELEGDVERLRRNLTSEKFERERAVQELRRHNINPPIPTMEYSSYPGYNRSFTARARSRSRSRSPSPSRSVNND